MSAPETLATGSTQATTSQIARETAGRLGRYELCFEVARGGMATLYLARVQGLGGAPRMVALKRIHDHFGDERKFVDMFVDEARMASQISHPNVCTVLDVGEADGSYFMVMEYLIAETFQKVLRQLIATGSRDDSAWPVLARIVGDACEGLHAAHELRTLDGKPLSVVHRDVSPQNLMVGYAGEVKVIDFGIADGEGRLHETDTGEVKGKFAYMAPEQLRGEAVDRRADVWALGVILWEALTGRRLFKRGVQSETMLAVLSEAIPRADQVDEAVPSALADIAARALERDRRVRFATAREMGEALQHALTQMGRTAGPAAIAELMTRLFPEGRDSKELLLRRAAQLQHTPSVRPPAIAESGTPVVPATRRAPPRWLWAALALPIVGASAWWLTRAPELAPSAPQAVVAEPPERERPERPASSEPASPDLGPGEDDATENDLPEDSPAPPVVATAPAPRRRPARRSAPRAPVPDASPGRLVVTVEGTWAYVHLDGERVGQTPHLQDLPPGPHTVRLYPEGRRAAVERRIRVQSGETTRVLIRVDDL